LRFALLFILLGIITNAKPVEKSTFVPRQCKTDITVEVLNKQQFFEYLSTKYDLRVSRLIASDPDLSHVTYLLEGLKRYGIPERIGVRWIYQESRFDSTAISPKGAYGYCQLMPRTWNELSCELGFECHTSINNIESGLKYLSDQYKTFGRWDLALAAYNSGPFRKCLYQGRIPRIPETEYYVNFILK